MRSELVRHERMPGRRDRENQAVIPMILSVRVRLPLKDKAEGYTSRSFGYSMVALRVMTCAHHTTKSNRH